MTNTDATSPTPDSDGLLVEEHDQVLSVRFTNPARANALSPSMLEDLVEIFRAPGEHVRAALLGGAGDRHFSSGIDLGDRSADQLVGYLPAQEQRLRAAADAIAGCPVPVIAVVNGAAYGGALELAVGCDWRIAAESARLGMPAARLGVVYAPEGIARFVAVLGPARTKQLFLTGATLDAQHALGAGLVEDVVGGSELWPTARMAAEAVASCAPLAVEGTRRTIDAIAHLGPEPEVLRAARASRSRAFASDDFREALTAFHEKRSPKFRGR